VKFNTVWAAYFSATDTTKKVVTTIANRIAEQAGVPVQTFDFTIPTARKTPKDFSEDDLVIFGTPVYAGRVPNLLVKYIATVEGRGAMGVPVVLYGHRNFDDALIELRNVMEQDGFRTVAGGAFVGEHSFSHTMAAGRPDASDLAIAVSFADNIYRKIEEITDFSHHKPVLVKGQDPIRPYFQPRDKEGNPIDIRKVKPETTDTCLKDCTICADLCPMGSINPANPKEVTGICIKCNACVKKCPVGAKVFTDPKFLYHARDIEQLYSQPRKEPEVFL